MAWSVGGFEVNAAEPVGSPGRAVIPIQRVENDEVQALRFEAPASKEADSTFRLSGLVPKQGGKFALLGHMQRAVPDAFDESWLVARSGDSSGLSKADTVLHRCSNRCTDRCLSSA